MNAQGHATGYRGWLASINPVFKLAAVVPPMSVILFTRDLATPSLVAGVAAMTLLTGVPLKLRAIALSTAMIILAAAWMTFFFAALTRVNLVAHTPTVMEGWLTLRVGALQVGAATTMRLIAIALLALLGSLGTTTDQLASALSRQCRIPYRFAYGALAAARFVPRYRQDLITLRAAQRARGIIDPPGPVGYLRRIGRALVPLLAGGARYAERLSLSMDARGFGAYRYRNERCPAVVCAHDVVFVFTVWGIIAAILIVTSELGLLQINCDLHSVK